MTGLNLPSGATIQDASGNAFSTAVTADLGVQVVTLVTNLHSSEDNLVYLLYQAAFDRMPDYAGFEYLGGQADRNNPTALTARRHIHGGGGIHRQIRSQSQQ